MLEWLGGLNPLVQATIVGLGVWAMAALGAAVVFLTRGINRRLLDTMLGFAGGVMLAASFWSLLEPALELSGGRGVPIWLPVASGFLLGGLFLAAVDRILPHLHPTAPPSEAEGLRTSWRRPMLVVIAITLHNFPEGLAVGVALGAAAAGESGATLLGALALAVGIGLHNLPEGMAVSLVCRREGFSRLRAWNYGQLSTVVEPVAAVLGAASVLVFAPLLPYALAFAAGAMIFVVVEEVIPEGHHGGNSDLLTWGAMIGFTVMMILDVALG